MQGVVGGSKAESLAWPLSRRSTKGAPKPGEILKAGSEQRPKPMARKRPAPGLAQRPGERGRAGEGGGGPAGGAGLPGGPGSAAGSAVPAGRPGQVRSQGNANQARVQGRPGPVQLPSGNTRKLASDRGPRGHSLPRGLVTLGAAREAQPSGGRQSSAGFGVAANAALTRLRGVGGGKGPAERAATGTLLVPLSCPFQTRLGFWDKAK